MSSFCEVFVSAGNQDGVLCMSTALNQTFKTRDHHKVFLRFRESVNKNKMTIK